MENCTFKYYLFTLDNSYYRLSIVYNIFGIKKKILKCSNFTSFIFIYELLDVFVLKSRINGILICY
jgi:hypothetical protein